MIVGRHAEREALASFLGDPSRSSAALVLEGEPGIGKTTLWLEALADAQERGYTILASEPAEPDAGVPLSTLGDLLDGVDVDALTALPEPQRAA
ncbi:MAG TPA: AAA family ATPase, partial [Actinomycetota bacterium]